MLIADRWSATRSGLTLVELLATLAIGGILFGLLATFSLREQRIFADVADNAALASRLGDAAAILPIDLRAVSATSGDLRDARDTSIELRATIGGAVVCDTIAGALVLPPAVVGARTYASSLAAIQPGDTAWLLVPTDTAESWRPHAVTVAARWPAGQCSIGGPVLDTPTTALPRTLLWLDGFVASATAIGMPLRVTRPVRYSLYHASDGGWYLGERDWNPATNHFNTIQPVSGPYLSAAAGGLTLVYVDTVGAVLQTPVADTRRVGTIRVTVRGQTKNLIRALGARGSTGRRSGTVGLTVLLRTR